MIRKTSKRRGTSVIAALIALCAVVGYGLTEWAPLDNEPQAVPARQREERQTVREKVEIPDKGEPVRLLTMNAGNYFVPEDPRRSNFQVKYKPVEAREAVAELVRQSGAEIVGLCEMGGERMKELALKRLTNLFTVKSIVTITLTITFCVLECCGSLSQDYMTIYTAVIGFYFGTQSKKDEDV